MASEGKIAKVSIKSAGRTKKLELVGLNQDRTLEDIALQLND